MKTRQFKATRIKLELVSKKGRIMNKAIFSICGLLLAGALALSLVSCVNEEIDPYQELHFDLTVNMGASPGTKVVKKTWESGDKIYLFFKKNNSSNLPQNKYAIATYNGSTWTVSKESSSSLTIGRSALGDYGTIYAVYLPLGHVAWVKDPSFNYESQRLFFGSENENSALNNYPVFSYYMIDTGSEYTVSGSTITATITMVLPDNFVYFYIEAPDPSNKAYNQNEKYRLAVEGVKPAAITGYSSGSFSQQQLAAGQPMWGYKYGNGIAFAGIIDNTWAIPAEHQFIFFSDGDSAITKTFTDISLASHESVKLKTPTAENGWSPYMTPPEYEEIGGIKWSKWNLGSTSATDKSHNYMFRWAEIVPDKGYSGFGKPTHSLTEDYAIFDPARATLGKDWRMPNRNDFNNLVSNCVISHNSEFFTFTSTSGDKSIKFITRNAIYGTGGSLYMWTSEIKDGTYVYVREYHPGQNVLSESSSGDNAKRILGVNLIRPIYIGE